MNSRLPCRLYLITPPQIDARSFAPVLESALDAGDVACMQLRLKGATDDDILRAGEILMPLAQTRGVAFIVNDRPDLAKRLGADGAHVGQEDMPYAQARALLGANRIVGVTCHDSRHLAMQAAEQGADYVAFGAFFATQTKQPRTMATPALITWWSELFEVPCVAIGGITPENGRPLVEAGADFLAVSSGVWDHAQGAAAAVRAFNSIFG
ncbi:MAG TPA: thiamine phosphate synthase [Micropepsaceae bacterium]|nr:thiamine phosphate synthase [Micropepsaceae bacterium]